MKKILKICLSFVLLFISFNVCNASDIDHCTCTTEDGCDPDACFIYKDMNVDGDLTIIADKVLDKNLEKYKEESLSDYIQDIVAYILTFVTLVGVLYIIYAGFRMLISSASGNNEIVGKTKKLILYIFIGMVFMRMAYSVFAWILDVVNA